MAQLIKDEGMLNIMHYTNINNLEFIFEKRTWKLSNILSMNDKKECIRKGVDNEPFGGLFLASFSRDVIENHAMWHIYGKNTCLSTEIEKQNKVCIVFDIKTLQNEDCVYKDYMSYFYGDGRSAKCYYKRDNDDSLLYDAYTITSKIINIEYCSNQDEVFEKSYIQEATLEGVGSGQVIDARNFGKFKTKSWEYENEIRLLTRINLSLIPYSNAKFQQNIYKD